MTDRRHVATSIWHCDPNAIVCPNDHLLAFYRTGYRGDLRRVAGHAFFECRECEPFTRFLILFIKDPSPMAVCYLLSKESFDEWNTSSEQTPPTPELLYRLTDPEGKSYNPHWRPPRNQR